MLARLSILLACLLTLPLGAAEPIKLVGSDLLQPVIGEALTKFAADNNLSLELKLDGTTAARKALLDGAANVAILALPADAEAPEGFETMPFAFQIVQVIINSSNPLHEISLDQLAAIYGIAGTRNYKQWSDLGLSNQWGNRTITLNAVRNDQSLALEIFHTAALKNYPIKTNINYKSDAREVLNRVADDASSIGLLPSFPLNNKVKLLQVSVSEGKYAYPPTAEAADFGDYPLSLRFVIVYGKENLAPLKTILQYLLSDELAESLEKKEFLAAPRNTRRENALTIGLQ